MYRCEVCGEVVDPGIPARKRVVETRDRTYPRRNDAGGRPAEPKGQRSQRKGDPGGTGHEIVREQLVCPECAEAANSAV
jgi:rubredoxin